MTCTPQFRERDVNEADVRSLLTTHPCGDAILVGLNAAFDNGREQFLSCYDARPYQREAHISECLDRTASAEVVSR